MECHQTFEENDVGWTHICRLLQACMLDEGILWDAHFVVALNQVDECLVSQVEIQCIWVIEVVLCDVDLSFVDACVESELLL